MTRRRTLPGAATLAALLLMAAGPVRPEMPTAEPRPGTLRAGETVLVDDGRCPRGQVSQVTGGDNLGGHHGTAPRTRTCVARP